MSRLRPHIFVGNEQKGFRQITRRSLEIEEIKDGDAIITSNGTFPLLPVLEVMKALRRPSFEPILFKCEAIFVDER